MHAFKLPVCAALLALSCCVHAAGDEIQVYGADINEPGESGLELHVNYVPQGSRSPAWTGQSPVHHMLRVTPELSWGLTSTSELGLYIPMIKAAGDAAQLEGLKGRIKFLSAPAERAWYAGLNFELGRVSIRTEESRWNAELRPILGWRSGAWEAIVNPILGWSLSDGHHKVPSFEPAFKVARKTGEAWALGVEHYSSLGPLNDWLPVKEREQNTYLVADGKLGETEINVGIGRGWRASGDYWVIKAVLGF